MKRNGVKEFKSPEKWNEERIETPSDIYSFGVVLYTLLTGRPPFVCKNEDDPSQVESLKNECINDVVPDIWTLRKSKIQETDLITPEYPDFPFWLNELVLKSLEKDPQKRYRSGKDINMEIQNGIKGLLNDNWPSTPISVTPKEEVKIEEPNHSFENSDQSTSKELHTKLFARNKMIIAALGVFCFIVIGFLIFQQIDKPQKHENDIDLIYSYFATDEKALDNKTTGKLTQYFNFPIYYYSKDYTEHDFVTYYLDVMQIYSRKAVRIDSIIPVINSVPNKYIVYGEFRKYKHNKNSYNTGKIEDEITIINGKIKKIIKK